MLLLRLGSQTPINMLFTFLWKIRISALKNPIVERIDNMKGGRSLKIYKCTKNCSRGYAGLQHRFLVPLKYSNFATKLAAPIYCVVALMEAVTPENTKATRMILRI